MVVQQFAERLKAAPTKPGVYIMRDAKGRVLYVGKAASLRDRLRSYFSSPSGQAPKVVSLVQHIADFEYITTESEQEALLLECNLIKRHKPTYNARLKDDKSYPYIKIDVSEEFPQVYITRRVHKDGARYYGPFASAGSVRSTLALLKKLFPYRSCTKVITGTDPRPCLDFYIRRCVGPCIGAVDKAQYRQVIDQVSLFLEGKTKEVVKHIEKGMTEAAERLEFERAAALRDQVRAIEKVHEGQKVLSVSDENTDVIALATALDEAWVEVFFIRQGKLIGRDHFIMANASDDEPGAVLTAFVEQFYDANPYVPQQILVQRTLDDQEAVEAWLRSKRVGAVEVLVPQRGEKRRLIEMVAENAAQGLEHLKVKQADTLSYDDALEELEEALSLPRPPHRIECYDISNIQGTNPVGSMVVLEDGRPKPSEYRRFKVKTVEGVDDYSMMREVLTRRFKRMQTPAAASADGAKGDGGAAGGDGAGDGGKWTKTPDLVLIDGGKGHLGAALQVFLELGISTNTVPLASLAKENEELFVPQDPDPIVLPRNSPALFMVQRARDEAHRFAITFHRERRSKNTVQSALDLVPGIGPKRRRLLLRRFGSTTAIREASLEDVAAVPGMTLALARKVKEYI
ncbi:MAG: excinuclease ABC subunit UvrC [SAR202 cluster bacterium]|nr:excinuclease ABC subunit UvrC [SAR202 cluster bacterium]